ncbi:MAG: FeoC-like transcriptional regulator [Rhodospirillaceae bacterium]|nr:FeoC-like transcriptional regulator [Rhodospirillaceae bacterium]
MTDLRDYLSNRKRASLSDLAVHFDTPPEALTGMLAVWMAKGRVRRLRDHLPCGTCGKCESATTDIYEWVGIDGCPDPRAAAASRLPAP